MPSIARTFAILSTWCLLWGIPTTQASPGKPGTLDPSWATLSLPGPGKVITPIGASQDIANALALQADGKVVVAGSCYNGADYDFCALRYNANGTLDANFNGGGTVMTGVGMNNDYANAVAVQADGKIVLAGGCINGTKDGFCALRFNSNGTLDTSFNGTGKIITNIGLGNDAATAVAVQPDGKLVLAGYCLNGTTNDFCALRYNADGTLDTSLNGTGKIITSVGQGDDIPYAIALQADGKLVLAGVCVGDNRFCAVRYNGNGSLDTGFNGTGKVISAGTPGDFVRGGSAALVLQPDGKLVIAGTCAGSRLGDFCAVRHNADGTLDTGFGNSGSISAGLAAKSVARGLALQVDGALVLAGFCDAVTTGSKSYVCVVRYSSGGIRDTAFGSAGVVTTTIGTGNNVANAIIVQPDGKLLVAGYCDSGTNYDFCAVRYDGGPFGYQNCKPDLDGDGAFLATTDALINMRIALGITGPAVVGGITFAPNATRNTWLLIRDYLITQCGLSLVQ